MKKRILVLATVAILVISALTFIACDNHTVKNQLTYGKKYICEYDLDKTEEKSEFFIFNSDGTGTYQYYSEVTSSLWGFYVSAYTINFKYLIDQDSEVVYCFYDSIHYNEENSDPRDRDNSNWSAVLNFTDKFLYSIDMTEYSYPHFYITEDFSSNTIPNFGK